MSGYNNQYGYPLPNYQPHYPSASYSQQAYPPPISVTNIYGLVVGLSEDRTFFLLYCKNFDDFVKIDSSVGGIMIGGWLTIEVFGPNYRGQFPLSLSNIRVYNSTIRPLQNVSARFFPQRRDDLFTGELLVTARFDVRANQETLRFEYISYDINMDHMVDNYNLIKESSPFYDGRSFIVEAQASLDGFVVVKVHEDPDRRLRCDNLSQTVVPHDVHLLDDTCLMTIMTGNGFAPSPEQPPHESANYQNDPGSRSSSTRSPCEMQNSNSSGTLADLRSCSEAELQALSSDGTILVPDAAVTERKTASLSRSDPDSDFEEDEMGSNNTRGTQGLLRRDYILDVGKVALKRCYTEKVLSNKTATALCVVVLKMPNCAILYTMKTGIDNVLVLEDSCQGLDDPLSLGDVAFFEIGMCRPDNLGKFSPKLHYSHIAVRKKPSTEAYEKKIELFKKSVRTFGGMVEMKVKILLTQPENLCVYRDEETTVKKSDEERLIYKLQATNGVQVTIPSGRLTEFICDKKLVAKFDLEAWAFHRKSVGDVSLHIGPLTEATRVYEDERSPLPPLCGTKYHGAEIKK